MFSSVKIDDKSRSFAVIKEKQNNAVKEILYINDIFSEDTKQHKSLKKVVKKYCIIDKKEENNTDSDDKKINDSIDIDNDDENDDSDGEDEIIKELKLKPEYEFAYCPPDFGKNKQRLTSFIVGKAGSGKSFQVANFLKYYHHMYPKNKIYFVSCADIRADSSFTDLVAKKSFRKMCIPVNLYSFRSKLEFKEFDNCIFVFDDVLDVKIPVSLENVAFEFLKTKMNARDIKVNQVYECIEREKRKLSQMAFADAKLIKINILEAMNSLLKNGRKNGISVMVTEHKLFAGPNSTEVLSEMDNVMLFPYGNTSDETLIRFLREKLSLGLTQAREIVKKQYMKFQFLMINVDGANFEMTSNSLKLLPK